MGVRTSGATLQMVVRTFSAADLDRLNNQLHVTWASGRPGPVAHVMSGHPNIAVQYPNRVIQPPNTAV